MYYYQYYSYACYHDVNMQFVMITGYRISVLANCCDVLESLLIRSIKLFF